MCGSRDAGVKWREEEELAGKLSFMRQTYSRRCTGCTRIWRHTVCVSQMISLSLALPQASA
jgi:hypothetical protein